MMTRAFCIPGVILLGCALVLSFIVSVSLPYLPALDITRARFNATVQQEGTVGIQELRLGIWAPCSYNPSGDRTCLASGYGYAVHVTSTANNQNQTATIHSAWTTGLAVHPVATSVAFLAFIFSFSTHLTMTLIASLLSFLAATLTLIAFAIDIALYGLVKAELRDFNVAVTTTTAPGFWLTFASLILLLLAGCTVCFGRRKRSGGTTTASSSKKARVLFAISSLVELLFVAE